MTCFEPSVDLLRESLFRVSRVYRERSNGDLQFDGIRPGPGWVAHGYFARFLVMLVAGCFVRRRLWKRRWLDPVSGTTQHSRPPDDAASVWFCTLVIVVELWFWLDGEDGLHNVSAITEGGWRPSTRTVQRWLSRALVSPMVFQQVVRRALIERSEPRPVEDMFPTGLSPPAGLLRRPWSTRAPTITLWRALALLVGGATALVVPVPTLLAEARGRMATAKASYMI